MKHLLCVRAAILSLLAALMFGGRRWCRQRITIVRLTPSGREVVRLYELRPGDRFIMSKGRFGGILCTAKTYATPEVDTDNSLTWGITFTYETDYERDEIYA